MCLRHAPNAVALVYIECLDTCHAVAVEEHERHKRNLDRDAIGRRAPQDHVVDNAPRRLGKHLGGFDPSISGDGSAVAFISIDSDFFKKGDTVVAADGSKMEVSFSDVNAPPLHVSCRCYIRPEEISLE